LTSEDVATFERCVAVGGVAVFPADTVYGLACEPDSREAVHRLYALKGRRPDKPAAVMFFDLELALAGLPELPVPTRAALERLLPGAVTVLLPNPARRFPLACAGDPATLGVRVPALAGPLAPLAAAKWPVLQSSANLSGEPPPRRLDDVAKPIRAGADLLLDAGELPGTASTVVDLRDYAESGAWGVVREGAVGVARLAEALSSPAG
jgi:L-threonylcarbamoyladenylate synthase